MEIVKKVIGFLGNYFAFVGGLLFIFTLGVIYAFIKPQGILINGIFLLLGIGWMGFLIKYFWDLVEKNESGGEVEDDTTEIHITDSSEHPSKEAENEKVNV
jgi:hypothetical protein